MAGLDDLLAQIPVADIARRLGADEGEVNCAVEHLVPSLLAGLQNNARGDAAEAGRIETAACRHAASGLLDGGVAVDDVDESDGDRIVANIFGGNTSTSVASALSGTGAGSSELIRKLLPILAPIVLAYIGKQFSPNPAAGTPQAAGGGGLGDLLGSILG
uniref:DUF937 domain-containing protein n=1 Tax=Mycolicibacterium palauense TaxID=2034511 RepID=UPI000BFEB2C1